MWGKAIQIGVLRRTQVVLLEKGVDWIPQMGGSRSPFAMAYACRNQKCRCIPVRADQWMRFATRAMSVLTLDEFIRLIDTLKSRPKEVSHGRLVQRSQNHHQSRMAVPSVHHKV